MSSDLMNDLMAVDWIKHKCKNDIYAQNLYAALCNNNFFKNDEDWSCSWRMAGGIVADLRDCGEDYLDWYCSGMCSKNGYLPEGKISSEITHDLLNLGWHIKPYEPKLEPGIYTNKW